MGQRDTSSNVSLTGAGGPELAPDLHEGLGQLQLVKGGGITSQSAYRGEGVKFSEMGWGDEKVEAKITSKRVVRSNTGTGAINLPPFFWYIHRPQCMILDVEPLLQSSFWRGGISPQSFCHFDPSAPPPLYLGTIF